MTPNDALMAIHIHPEISVAFEYGVIARQQLFSDDIQVIDYFRRQRTRFFNAKNSFYEMFAIKVGAQKLSEKEKRYFTTGRSRNLTEGNLAGFFQQVKSN